MPVPIKEVALISRIAVVGWLPPPVNGRTNEVTALLKPPFTDQYDISSFDTRIRVPKEGPQIALRALTPAIGQFGQLSSHIRSEHPELIVFFIGPGISFWRDLFLVRQCIRSGIPTIVRFIGGLIADQVEKMTPPLRRTVIGVLGASLAIFVETEEMALKFRTMVPDKPVVRVPNFIHLVELPPMKSKSQTESSKLKLVFFGNLTPLKGAEILLNSIDRICDECQAEFHIIGGELKPGYFEEFKGRVSRLKHSSDVKLYGRRPKEETFSIAAECEIFVFPSMWPGEGQPAALVEAMGLGLIPVVSSWRGLGEVVSDRQNGMIIDMTRAEDSLVESIRELGRDAEFRRSLSLAARSTVERFYDAPPALQHFNELTSRLIAG